MSTPDPQSPAVPPSAPGPGLPDASALLVDLRPAPLRAAAPLPALPNRVVTLTLDVIEDGGHGLTAGADEVVVLCERGVRSTLAARLLRADGVNASAYPGGVPALLRALP